MATTRTGGHKAMKASQHEAEKENRPPQKGAKRTASIAGMFDNARNVRFKTSEKSAGDLFPPKATHNNNAGDGLFARFSSKRKAEQHPLYLSFADAANAYEEGAAASGAEQLQPVYEELVARTNGLDIHGRALDVPGVPTKADLDALDAEESTLSKPLGEEKIEIQVRQADGTMRRKHVTLDANMNAFRQRYEKKHAELEKLGRELARVDEELAEAKEDALNDTDGSVKRAHDRLQAKQDKISRNIKIFREQTFNEVKQAEQEDKAAAVETNRKIQEFMKALQ
ncbi:hypothetical protein LTR36_005009 [Oleoguttula mirabilis]|uniref:Uncharacterized protein n=1 Tax=Oleoguttula mirabilis TaxID=1507867 RepID=A0AAV9JXB8_9PEZI|nr:hypothetical protein LTR36_005009 [Oleoguttula mirabilis]